MTTPFRAHQTLVRFAAALLALGVALAGVRLASARAAGLRQQGAQRARIAFDHDVPAMDGQHLNLKVVDVRYGPGESSTPHKHGCAVVVYVVAGTMRMQVRGGVDSVYHSGETFYESPTDIHQVSANVSVTDSARFTATFLCDHAGPLSVPAGGTP
jgi:quercetin dioxygenase-like cupin family protein